MLSKESESVPTVELIYQPIYEYDKSFKIIMGIVGLVKHLWLMLQ